MLNIVFWFVVRKCVCNSVIDNFRAELMAANDEPGPEPEIDIEEAGHGEGEVVHLDENVTPDEDEGDTPLASSGGSGVEELPDLPDLSHDDEVAEVATQAGARVHRRSADAATDTASSEAVLEDFVQAGRHGGAEVLERLDQHAGLDGHVQRAGDAHAGEGLRRAVGHAADLGRQSHEVRVVGHGLLRR